MYMPKGKANKQAQSKEDKAMTNIFEETYNRIERSKESLQGSYHSRGQGRRKRSRRRQQRTG
jgi:hypothetical protein